MTYNYTKAKKIARRQISKYGSSAIVIQIGSTGGYDSSGNVTADVPDVLIAGTSTPIVMYKKHEIDEASIQAGDGWVYFFSDQVTQPAINMQITLSGETYRIIKIHSLTSVDDVNIYIKLQLRF
jgi:hypothetical protein